MSPGAQPHMMSNDRVDYRHLIDDCVFAQKGRLTENVCGVQTVASVLSVILGIYVLKQRCCFLQKNS